MSNSRTVDTPFSWNLVSHHEGKYRLARGDFHHYRYEEDDVDIWVPEAQRDFAEGEAEPMLLYAVNVALGIDTYRHECVSSIDTVHGTDEIERHDQISMIKLADYALAECSLFLKPESCTKVAGIFGKSAVLLCKLDENAHERLDMLLRDMPSPDATLRRIAAM